MRTQLPGARERRLHAFACAPAVRDPRSALKRNRRRSIAMAMSLASSAPVTGNSQFPSSSFLPTQMAGRQTRIALPRSCTSISERFFLHDDNELQPRAQFAPDPKVRSAMCRQVSGAASQACSPRSRRCRGRPSPDARRDRFSRRDHADFRLRAARGDDVVQPVGPEPRHHGVALIILQALFLIEDSVAHANIEAAWRHDESGWNDRPSRDRARRRSSRSIQPRPSST